MRVAWRFPIAAVLLVLGLALLANCESSDVLAPSGGKIIVTANPSTVQLDPDGGVTTGQTTVVAQVFDAAGFPQPGVTVFFSSDGGVLGSTPPPGTPGPGVVTDDNGRATDTLTVSTADNATIKVTASSGVITGEATVTRRLAGNQQPTAEITATPSTTQVINQTVLFDGSGSEDPDDTIKCYQWEITSSLPIVAPELPCVPASANCEIAQGSTRTTFSKTYSQAQTLTVVLRVSDDADTECSRTGPTSDGPFSSNTDSLAYSIVAALPNTPPVARIAANPATSAQVNVPVNFNGSTSSDSDAGDAITCYQWKITSSLPITSPTMPCPGTPTPTNCEVVQGTAETVVTRTYAAVQSLSVVLRVSDNDTFNATTCPTSGTPIAESSFNSNAASLNYTINP